MINCMHIGFIQLPVPGHHAIYAKANRPLAAAYMIAFARKHCRRKNWEAEILPDDLANHGGDAAVVDWIRNGRFDALFFTLYLWNRERSLFLARLIKARRPEILIIMGGPEVTDDQNPSDFPGVDLLCVGEGEEFFARFVDDPILPTIRGMHLAASIDDLARVPNPYLTGLLPVHSGDIIHFEQMRGCPQRCAYCYYGKGHHRVHRFPSDRVPGIFRLASAYDRTEIYFMDPTFNIREGLEDHLGWIAQNNPDHIPIHTEVRLELIDPLIADCMAATGIRSVEAGLQSVNPKALAAVGRRWDRKAFLQGARLLKERGIEVRAGIIIGLPEDGLEDFIATLDFLESAGLSETMECFILSILPGTKLRSRLSQWRMEAMSHPPYWILSTSRMDPEDFATAIQILERGGIDYFPPIPPMGPAIAPGFWTAIDLRRLDLESEPDEVLNPAALANSITIFVDAHTADHARLAHWADFLLNAVPHACWRIVYSGNEASPSRRWQRLCDFFLMPDHFLNRSHYLCRDHQKASSVRLFQVIDDIRSVRQFLDAPPQADLVVRPRPGQAAGWEEICCGTPWIFIDPHMTKAEHDRIESWYVDCPERMINLPPHL